MSTWLLRWILSPERAQTSSLEETVTNLKQPRETLSQPCIYIRAPVASGKSTLVYYLTTKHSDEFISIGPEIFERDWFDAIITAGGNPSLSVEEALLAIAAQRKTIVVDEAQLLFQFPKVVFRFFKSMELSPINLKIIMFSAVGNSARDGMGNPITAPPQINHKYLWYPSPMNVNSLSKDLTKAKPPVLIHGESIDFLSAFCGGHRGILMHALAWVQQRQNNSDGHKPAEWNLAKTAAEVRNSIGKADKWNGGLLGALKCCRAVRVDFSLAEIPPEFATVLFGGPKEGTEINNLGPPS